jgi:hypothetical protein
MAASCALLSHAVRSQTLPSTPSDTEQPLHVDSGFLFYKEDGGRIQSYDAIVSVRKDLGDERSINLSLAYDSLSGGSPNGAAPANTAQTFATPSGTSLLASNGAPATYTTPSGREVAQLEKVTLYTVQPGELPLDPSFKDRRFAGDLSWSQPLGIGNHLTVGGHLSHELDFTSVAGSAFFSHDFNSKNTTLGLGANVEFDTVNPIGGVPQAGSDYTQLLKSGSDTKHVMGGQLGLTQVLTRNWLAQVNLSYDRSTGYLTDPYKILSQLDANGAISGYLFESRPDSRARRSVYFGNKVAIGSSVLDVSYRHGLDDWGIRSDTAEGRLRFKLGDGGMYLEPHLRWYRQSAADFYHLYLDAGAVTPQYMSADSRLAAFTAGTIGMKLGLPLSDRNEVSFRLEAYQQTPTVRSSSLPALQGLDLNPRLRSIILQVNWDFAP